MLSITIHGNININLGGTDAELLSQLTQLRENAMSLKTQADIDAFVAQINTAASEANAATQAEGQQVSQVIADLQAMIDNGVTDVSGLEAAVAALGGVKTNIEGIYVPAVTETGEVEPAPPAPAEPEPGTGTETAEPLPAEPVTDGEPTDPFA